MVDSVALFWYNNNKLPKGPEHKPGPDTFRIKNQTLFIQYFPPMPRKQRWSREVRETFFKVLRATGNVSAAARSAGVSLHNAYLKKTSEVKFSREWEAAIEEALDDLEGELRRRALEGTEKAVYYAGKEIGSITSYNDNLAMFLLKSRRGHIYGEMDVMGYKGSGKKNFDSPREKLLAKLKNMKSKAGPTPGNKK